MICEQQARGVRTLSGKAKATADQWGSDLELAQGCEQRSAFQPLFQGPGGIEIVVRFDDQEQRRIEAEFAKSGAVRVAPLLRCLLREAPQHDAGSGFRPCHPSGDDGEGKGER